MDSPALTLSQAHESTRLVCHARFVLSEISVHYWEHYPQRPWHISVAGLSLCISTDDSLASPAYIPKSASIGTIVSRINTPDTLCFLHILRFDLNSHSASKWQLHMLPRYIHVRPSHARLKICMYYHPRSAPGECRPVMVWLLLPSSALSTGELVHKVYWGHVYSCHCSDSHLPEQLFSHGHDDIGPGPDKILHIFQSSSEGELWICTLDKDGNAVSFFNFIETQKNIGIGVLAYELVKTGYQLIAPAWTHHSCMLAIDLLL